MENVITGLAGFVSGLTPFANLVIIIVLIFVFKDQISEKIFGKKNGNGEKKESIPAWAERLIQYGNHDMTEWMEKNNKLLEEIRDGINDVNLKHKEWDLIGIPTRECKTK